MLVEKFLRFFACLVLVNTSGYTVNGTPDKLVCYLNRLSLYRSQKGTFPIRELPPNLCTHLVYSSVSVVPQGTILLTDEALGFSSGAFDAYNDLKKANPRLKTLISVGGGNASSSQLSSIFSDAEKRQTFAKSAADFLKKHGFDGLDLDWEYPAQNGGMAEDKRNFVELCKDLDVEFSANQYLLTVAVAPTNINQSYDVANLVKYVDFFNLMAYNFHTDGPTTGQNAPSYASYADKVANNSDINLNVEATVKIWLKQGVPPSKLILGMPLFGRSFTLSTPWTCFDTFSVRCKTTEKGSKSSIMKYNEICLELIESKHKDYIPWLDAQAFVPYYIYGNKWVSYENQQSLTEKMDIIFENDLGGGMVWSIDSDDYSGACGLGKYPLLTHVSQRIVK